MLSLEIRGRQVVGVEKRCSLAQQMRRRLGSCHSEQMRGISEKSDCRSICGSVCGNSGHVEGCWQRRFLMKSKVGGEVEAFNSRNRDGQ